MEYFTRAWALGDLSDEEFEKVEERYRTYLGSLDQGGPVFRFATSVSLNDAYVDGLKHSEGALSLRLLTGDLQRGYWHTELICLSMIFFNSIWASARSSPRKFFTKMI